MGLNTKFLHTYTCDMCQQVMQEDILGDLHPDYGTEFRVEAPGVKKTYNSIPDSRRVYICNHCRDTLTIADFVNWLERTKK